MKYESASLSSFTCNYQVKGNWYFVSFIDCLLLKTQQLQHIITQLLKIIMFVTLEREIFSRIFSDPSNTLQNSSHSPFDNSKIHKYFSYSY